MEERRERLAAEKLQRDADRANAKAERNAGTAERTRLREEKKAAKKKNAAEDTPSKPRLVWSAASLGNLDNLRHAIENELPVTQPGNPDPTVQVDGLNQSALHKASENGHPLCLALLLDQPIVNIDQQSKPVAGDFPGGSTALHMAALNANLECVRVLLDARADIELTNAKGKTPFDVVRRAAARACGWRVRACGRAGRHGWAKKGCGCYCIYVSI